MATIVKCTPAQAGHTRRRRSHRQKPVRSGDAWRRGSRFCKCHPLPAAGDRRFVHVASCVVMLCGDAFGLSAVCLASGVHLRTDSRNPARVRLLTALQVLQVPPSTQTSATDKRAAETRSEREVFENQQEITTAFSSSVPGQCSREIFGYWTVTCSTTLNSVQPRRCSQRARTAVLRVQLRWTFVKHACGKL